MRRSLSVSVAALAGAIAVVAPASIPADVTSPPAAKNRLELRGADAMVPTIQLLAESFMSAHPDEKVMVAGHFADRGVKSLIVGVADMAMAVDTLTEDTEALAAARKVKPTRTCIFRDAMVPVVSPDNPVRDISLERLRDVFRGKIKNWRDLGGKDAPITVVSQEFTSGAYAVWKTDVLGEDVVLTPDAIVATEDEYSARITTDAIGFLGMNFVGVGIYRSLRALSVNGTSASLDSVRSGAYPIVRESCLYQLGEGTPLGNAFIEYLFSPEGQSAIASKNLVPVPRDAP